MIADPVFYLLAIPAVILFGLSKGGFSGISALGTPLVAMAVGPTRAAGIILPILVVQDALGILMFRRDWDRRIILTMLPGAAAGVLLAYLFASHVSQALVEIVLGTISLLFAFLPPPRKPVAYTPAKSAGSPGLGALAGAASGFTSMIAHAGVPPFQLYVMPKNLPRDIYIGTSIVFFAATNYLKLIPFALLGQFDRQGLLTSAILFPLALMSTWAGARLVKRVDTAKFYSAIRILLAGTSAILVCEGLVKALALPLAG